jgi:hypothetical protein
MFDPNEDIEDLYRRAADGFDLDSSGPDWERMSRALDKLTPAPRSPIARLTNLRKFITAPGRIIPVGMGTAVVIAGLILMVNKRVAHKPGKEAPLRAATYPAGAAGNTGAAKTVIAKAVGSTGAGGAYGNRTSVMPELDNGPSSAGPDNGSSSAGLDNGPSPAGPVEANGPAGHPDAVRANGAPGGKAPAEGGNPFPNRSSVLADIPLTTNTDLPLTLEQVRISTDRLQLIHPLQPLGQGVSAGPGPVVSPLRAGGRFSAGVSGSLDLSFVEGQSLSQPGSSAGILAGMQVTRRLNLETGVYISHKVYYTSSGHFPNVPLPNGGKLLNVRGHSSMVEIPLTLRYSFMGTQSGAFYAGAGIAAYLVNSEVYHYQAEWQGTTKNGEWVFPGRIPQHVLSVLTTNIGYRLNLGKTDMLRTELYGKLPLAGVGKASVPVTSAGLSLSFMHAF